MDNLDLSETQDRWSEVLRRADACGPQPVTGPGGDAYILSVADYERFFVGFTFEDEDDTPVPETVGFVEFMRTSPLAHAMAAGEISPEEWDRACRIGR